MYMDIVLGKIFKRHIRYLNPDYRAWQQKNLRYLFQI